MSGRSIETCFFREMSIRQFSAGRRHLSMMTSIISSRINLRQNKTVKDVGLSISEKEKKTFRRLITIFKPRRKKFRLWTNRVRQATICQSSSSLTLS